MYNYDWSNPGQIEWAYLAGFFDGDGSINAMKMDREQKMPQLQMTFANHDIRVLEIAQRAFGCGCIYSSARTMWHLGGSQQVAEALRCLRPYLNIKGEQADVALEIAQRPHMRQGMSKEERRKEYAIRFDLQQKLRALKPRSDYEPYTEEDRADALYIRGEQ